MKVKLQNVNVCPQVSRTVVFAHSFETPNMRKCFFGESAKLSTTLGTDQYHNTILSWFSPSRLATGSLRHPQKDQGKHEVQSTIALRWGDGNAKLRAWTGLAVAAR